MVDKTLAASVPASRKTAVGAVLAGLGLAALAIAYAWADAEANAWAAAALIAALGLDVLGRIAGRSALGRSPAPRGVALPSLVLASERGLLAVAFLFVAGLLFWQDGFAVLASLLAGLLAMGGIARLAIARVVLAGEAADDAET